MVTIIILLTLLSIKDELVGLIDLYSTLQGNLVVYFFNTYITIFLGLIEIRYISVYEGSWANYLTICIIVSFISASGGVLILNNKKKLKNILRRKRISKSMKQKWIEKKQEPLPPDNFQI